MKTCFQERKISWVKGLVLVVVLLFAFSDQKEVRAAQPYKCLELPAKDGVPKKNGNYYFMRRNSGTDIYVSAKKKSGYKKAIDSSTAYTNGRKLYYIENSAIYEYMLANGRNKKIRTLPSGSDYWITASYGQRLYISRSYIDIGKIKVSTYAYNIKNKKLQKVKNSLHIVQQAGEYVLATPEPMANSSLGTKNAIYRITSKDIKRVWKLPWVPWEVYLTDGKLYFDKPLNGEKAELYCYNLVEKKLECILSLERQHSNQHINVSTITDKYCLVVYWNYAEEGVPKAEVYKYVFKTGKLKRAMSLDKNYG